MRGSGTGAVRYRAAPADRSSLQRTGGIVLQIGGLLAGLLLTVSAPVDADEAVSLKAVVQPILNKRCVVCHLPGAASANLVLTPGAAAKALIGAASEQSPLVLVQPGAPEMSYLLHKLLGTHQEAGGEGVRMPLEQGRMPDEEIAAIRNWIKGGARE